MYDKYIERVTVGGWKKKMMDKDGGNEQSERWAAWKQKHLLNISGGDGVPHVYKYTAVWLHERESVIYKSFPK